MQYAAPLRSGSQFRVLQIPPEKGRLNAYLPLLSLPDRSVFIIKYHDAFPHTVSADRCPLITPVYPPGRYYKSRLTLGVAIYKFRGFTIDPAAWFAANDNPLQRIGPMLQHPKQRWSNEHGTDFFFFYVTRQAFRIFNDAKGNNTTDSSGVHTGKKPAYGSGKGEGRNKTHPFIPCLPVSQYQMTFYDLIKHSILLHHPLGVPRRPGCINYIRQIVRISVLIPRSRLNIHHFRIHILRQKKLAAALMKHIFYPLLRITGIHHDKRPAGTKHTHHSANHSRASGQIYEDNILPANIHGTQIRVYPPGYDTKFSIAYLPAHIPQGSLACHLPKMSVKFFQVIHAFHPYFF